MRLLIGLVEGNCNLVDLTSCYRTLNSSSRPHPSLSSPVATPALIIVSAIVKDLRFPREPLRTLRLCAFARNQTAWAGFSQRRKGAKFAKILLKAAQFLSGGRNDNQGSHAYSGW